MKQFQKIWMPDTERELVDWMSKHGEIVDGKGTYQYPKIRAALAQCKQFRRCIEQGSHIGLWTRILVREFEVTECFEPVAHLRACWMRNIDMSGRVRLHECALGKQPGRVAMVSNPVACGDSSVAAPNPRVILGRVAEPVDIVEMRTIDSFNFGEVDLIKLDAEGYEENIARGAEETIKRCKPVVIIEQKRDMATRFGLEPQGGVAYLESLGYAVSTVLAGDFIMVPVA